MYIEVQNEIFFNLTIICAHAPTEEKADEVKEAFYDKLEWAYHKVASNDVKIIMGDMNAKLGRERIFSPYLGKHNLHEESNGNGLKLVDFAMSKNLTICSTHFQHKNIQATWRSPDGNTTNQMLPAFNKYYFFVAVRIIIRYLIHFL